MIKIMTANEAANRSSEAKAQYCNLDAYNNFMEMLAEEIKIATNNGWTSTAPLRWGYLPDGWQNKVITELSGLGYKVNTVEDRMTVSWYGCETNQMDDKDCYAITYKDYNYKSKRGVRRICVTTKDMLEHDIVCLALRYDTTNFNCTKIRDLKEAQDLWEKHGYKPLDDEKLNWEL